MRTPVLWTVVSAVGGEQVAHRGLVEPARGGVVVAPAAVGPLEDRLGPGELPGQRPGQGRGQALGDDEREGAAGARRTAAMLASAASGSSTTSRVPCRQTRS